MWKLYWYFLVSGDSSLVFQIRGFGKMKSPHLFLLFSISGAIFGNRYDPQNDFMHVFSLFDDHWGYINDLGFYMTYCYSRMQRDNFEKKKKLLIIQKCRIICPSASWKSPLPLPANFWKSSGHDFRFRVSSSPPAINGGHKTLSYATSISYEHLASDFTFRIYSARRNRFTLLRRL